MAKADIDTALLKEIVTATSGELGYMFVSPIASKPMAALGLVEVNDAVTNPADPTQLATRATPKASEYLNTTNEAPVTTEKTNYSIIKGAVLPATKKRGGSTSGAPTKYPFASMEVGDMFFEPNSNHKKGDAVKALGSTISSQNRKYSEPTGETRVVKQAVKVAGVVQHDAAGKKVTEDKTIPKLKYSRKFTIRAVVSGEKYGEFVAPADGALIARTI